VGYIAENLTCLADPLVSYDNPSISQAREARDPGTGSLASCRRPTLQRRRIGRSMVWPHEPGAMECSWRVSWSLDARWTRGFNHSSRGFNRYGCDADERRAWATVGLNPTCTMSDPGTGKSSVPLRHCAAYPDRAQYDRETIPLTGV
jgi:hypothetical protein